MRSPLLIAVARRAVPAGLVVLAAFADASGSPRLGFYAFLALVPVAAITALNAYGDVLEHVRSPEEDAPRHVQALLWGVLLAVAVTGTAARSPALDQGSIPKLAATALIVALVVLCVEGLLELFALARRLRTAR
jgi:choline-glycine betaine transporter